MGQTVTLGLVVSKQHPSAHQVSCRGTAILPIAPHRAIRCGLWMLRWASSEVATLSGRELGRVGQAGLRRVEMPSVRETPVPVGRPRVPVGERHL